MTIPSDITTFNGATVAELILGKLDPNVDHLIDVLSTKNSNSLESPLLEFKGTWRKPKDDVSPDDLHKWNVVKALIAMYNAYGGCVLVGLAEGHPDKTQLKLLNCDPDGILANPKNEWKDLQSHLFTELFKGEKGQGLFKTGTDESYQIPSASLAFLKRHVAAYLCSSQRYGGNVIALIVAPLGSNREAIYISHKSKRENGSDFKETLLYHRDHLIAESPSIPESGKPCDPNAWIRYFEERQTILASAHFKSLLENAPERQNVTSSAGFNEEELLSALLVQMSQDKILELFNQYLSSSCYVTTADNNGIATDNIPLHTLNALTNDVSRSQKLALLDGKHFEAICIKSCGNLGFLSHRDFENGIYIHAAVTNNTPLVEGQRWHVTVGARVNKKKGSWCYCALTAKLLSQGSSVAHQYKDIAAPENRTATVKNLKGIFYEAICTFGKNTCGYLSHPDFEGQIYIDIPVTGGIPIHTGQKWRFEVGAHCLPPEGMWIYRARNATLVSEATEFKYPLNALVEKSAREQIKATLKGLTFNAPCTVGRGTCGGLSHPDFEGHIYIDLPVTNNIHIAEGQQWRFQVSAHCMGPNGPWVYRARKATLVIPNEVTYPSSPRQFHHLSELQDDTLREKTVSSLASQTFEATCIKSCGTFGFLGHSDFENGIFLHKSVTSDHKIEEGQIWRVTVGARFNDKQNIWSYAALTAELFSEPEPKQTSSTAPLPTPQQMASEQPIAANGIAKEKEVAPPSTTSPIHRLSELQDDSLREKTVSSLASQTFEATCIKGCGTFGFLGHSDFENGIFLHKSVTSDRKIEEGQIWRVNVGARFNDKQNTWCYAALTAELLSQAYVEGPDSATQPSSRKIAAKERISIYIDETWPGTQDATYKDIGVIGGIAVAEDGWEKQILPVIRTHIRDYNYAREITRQMLATPCVFPFVLPIKLDRNACASYFELVQHAILLLLGWLLPHGGHNTVVDIYLEHITAFKDGHSETDFFNVLQQAMKLLGGSKRFSQWKIRQVKWVPKQFEYVPYADLVCQTCVPLPDQQKYAQDVKVRTWTGFLPFTPALFPLLRDMDTASPSGFADLLISFARTSRDTPLFKRILRQAVERAQREAPFRDAMLERFESCYEQKDRDIALLNRLTEPFFDAFPPRTFSNSPRMHLLRMLLEMQRANHNGDPEAVNLLVADYKVQRQRLLAIDRELCAYADLNLVVHDHDLFRFEEGLSTANSWIEDSLFPALSLVNRGRMVSSRGQSYALLKRYEDADREFSEAISLFKSEAELYKKEIDQTRVYQCFNLLDLEPSRAVDVMETILHNSLQAAGMNPANALGNPYHEHLFLKVLWTLRHNLKQTIQDYLTHRADWPAVHDCHPYELILFYRTLLIFDHDRNAAQNLARNTEALFERMSYGGTIGLIHSYIRVVFKHMQIGVASDAEFKDELNIVEGYLPAARPRINLLRRAWEDPSLDVSSVLPFNYK